MLCCGRPRKVREPRAQDRGQLWRAPGRLRSSVFCVSREPGSPLRDGVGSRGPEWQCTRQRLPHQKPTKLSGSAPRRLLITAVSVKEPGSPTLVACQRWWGAPGCGRGSSWSSKGFRGMESQPGYPLPILSSVPEGTMPGRDCPLPKE